MLVLSRKKGETLLIGNEVRLTVLEVRGGKLTLGIEAPREVTVLRAELEEKPDPDQPQPAAA